jgi:hypothetical protein
MWSTTGRRSPTMSCAKKTDVEENPKVFHHAGLFVNRWSPAFRRNSG